MEDLILDLGVSALLSTIKNAAKRASIRAQMLKVFKAIQAAYAGDPDFS